jgi:predicted nucleic acid-binding Zn ribbon protein
MIMPPKDKTCDCNAQIWCYKGGYKEKYIQGIEKKKAAAKKKALTPERTHRACTVCTKSFLAKRADAKQCSPRCRTRASRNANRKPHGQTVTDKQK